MNSSIPKILDVNHMSLTTTIVLYSMIAFLILLFVLLGALFFKAFFSGAQKKQTKAKKIESKGFGGFSS